MKTSNATGHDSTSIKIYKMLAYRLGPHIQHLINTIIMTATYPDILKLSKITPQKKPDKPTDKIDSYRPINNLYTLDKIVEQYIKTHLDKYLDKNDIIPKHHHGSRKGHGTDTAALDTIDATALTDKLQYYRVT